MFAVDPKSLIFHVPPAGTLLAMVKAMEAGKAALLGAAELATSTVN